MQRKHVEPPSAPENVKAASPSGLLLPRKAGALIGPWLKLANLLPPLDDVTEMSAVWSRILSLMGSRSLAEGVRVRRLQRVVGRAASQWFEGPELRAPLPNATNFMKVTKDAGLAELISVSPQTEEQALLDLALQTHFVLAGLTRRRGRARRARRPRRVSLSFRAAYDINPPRAASPVRLGNPFTRFTRALQAIDTSRLRRCSVCNKFFYASRKDASCCSRECSHKRRQHRFVGNWEQYRRARAFRTRAGLPAVKGKERRRLMELSEALRETEAKERPER